VLTPELANVLNQTLAENLRNNFAPRVTQANEEAAKEGAAPVDLAGLQKELNDYTKEYEFGARRQAGVAVNPVEKQALILARDAVKKAIAKAGKNVKDYTADQLNELAKAAVAKNPAFTASAEKVVAARKEAASETLTDIAA